MKHSESFAGRTLLEMARQHAGQDPELCRLVFGHLDTSASLGAAIHLTLGEFRLTELRFGVIVVLYSLHPNSSTPADLAACTAVSRSAMTEAIDQLEADELVRRTRDDRDRRILNVQLTPEGLKTVEPALHALLGTVGRVTRFLDDSARKNLLDGYALLQAGAEPSAS